MFAIAQASVQADAHYRALEKAATSEAGATPLFVQQQEATMGLEIAPTERALLQYETRAQDEEKQQYESKRTNPALSALPASHSRRNSKFYVPQVHAEHTNAIVGMSADSAGPERPQTGDK